MFDGMSFYEIGGLGSRDSSSATACSVSVIPRTLSPRFITKNCQLPTSTKIRQRKLQIHWLGPKSERQLMRRRAERVNLKVYPEYKVIQNVWQVTAHTYHATCLFHFCVQLIQSRQRVAVREQSVRHRVQKDSVQDESEANDTQEGDEGGDDAEEVAEVDEVADDVEEVAGGCRGCRGGCSS